MPIPGFVVLTTLVETADVCLERARRESDGRTVLLKRSWGEAGQLRLRREHEMLARLALPGLPHPCGLHRQADSTVLEWQDIPGQALAGQLLRAPWDGREVLRLALALAQALDQLHQAGFLYRCVCPAAVFWDGASGVATLTELFAATEDEGHVRGHPAFDSDVLAAEVLPYLAPEDAGRMARGADRRSDLYALGATLYCLATGHAPFAGGDPLQLIHSQLALVPRSPQDCAATDATLSAIIMKLLDKNPERRYQSGAGLMADLRRCLEQIERGRPAGFALGQQDGACCLQMGERLYGRAAPLSRLVAALGRVAGGAVELLLVAGYSGIGKSALVHELRQPVREHNGAFIEGKFEQYQRNIPYSALSYAFRQLVQQWLASRAPEPWRRRVLEAVGANAQVLVEVIPELGALLGAQPALPLLGPTETRNRFNRAFHDFLCACCGAGAPLAIFLDDLQWADEASLSLLGELLASAELGHLLLIGAYRDNEAGADDPLGRAIAGWRLSRPQLETLALAPLTEADLAAMLADTLGNAAVLPLAELLFRKTNGNPFFVCQLLRKLAGDGWLAFDGARGAWQWDLARIASLDISANVIDVVVERMRHLSPAARGLLSLAACLGEECDLADLALISPLPRRLRGPALDELRRAELVMLGRAAGAHRIRFVHDRVQQAAYSLLPAAGRQRTHLRIARQLSAVCGGAIAPERLFAVAGQFNAAHALIGTGAERRRVAAINLQAAERAIAATAYGSARQFARAAAALLGEGDWDSHYGLQVTAHDVLARAEYLAGNLTCSLALVESCMGRLRTPLEQARFYNLAIVGHTLAGAYREAVDAGRAGLALLGIGLPEQDAELAFSIELGQIEALMAGRGPAALLDCPRLDDPLQQMAQTILLNVDVPAYIGVPALYPLIIAKMAHISLAHGHSLESCKSYGTFGVLLGARFGQYQRGHEFARLGWQLLERLDAPAIKCKTAWPYAVATMPWVRPLRDSLPYLQEGVQSGLATGDLQFVGYLSFSAALHRYVAGHALPLVLEQIEQALPLARSSRNQWALDSMQGLRCAVQALLAEDGPGQALAGEADYAADCAARASHSSLCFYHCYRAQRLIIDGHYGAALEHAEQARDKLSYIVGFVAEADVLLFCALAAAALPAPADEAGAAQRRRHVERARARLGLWQQCCPENFSHRYQLLEAQSAAAEGRTVAALEAYRAAIEGAQQGGFVQDAALAGALLGRYWLALGFPAYARLHFAQAAQDAGRWKAAGLARRLSQAAGGGQRGAREGAAFDVDSVLKAAQAISGEIKLEKLLAALTHILIEHAGAQRGVLILNCEGALRVMAEGAASAESVQVLLDKPLDASFDGVLAVVNFVQHTRTAAVLDDAALDPRFAADPTILAARPKSILCAPIIKQGELYGIVYLENNLTAGAFAPDRVQVLEILAAQAATALENAQIYDKLDRRVRERTEALGEAYRQLGVAHEELKHDALHDVLTGLPNRICFNQRFDSMWQRFGAGGEPFALMYLDLDRFKQVNDTLGHDYGDLLLQAVSALMRGCMREQDLLARLGGDEFAALLPGVDCHTAAAAIAARIVAAFQAPIRLKQQDVGASCSIGIAVSSAGRHASREDLLRAADQAMYLVKKAGRKGFQFSEPAPAGGEKFP